MGFLRVRRFSTILLSGFVPLLALAASPAGKRDPDQVILAAMAQAQEVPRQARALIDLAWPAAPDDPAIAARARTEIVGFGETALPYLRAAIKRVKAEQQADVVRAFMEAYRRVSGGSPVDYIPGLEEAVWYGSEDAKKAAIPEIARFRVHGAVLTIVDAAYEFPDLTLLCVDALGKIGDDHARVFLEKLLNEGKPEVSEAAASSLAQIGGRALPSLRAGLRSENRTVRLTAARALLPVAGLDDLSALFEYLDAHPADDAATTDAVRQATVMLEKQREAKEAAAAASGAPH